jgi:molybdopterin molybdotransferase
MGDEPVGLAEYLTRVLPQVSPLRPMELDLPAASGGVLADDVRTEGPLPAYDHAAVDGYALRAADLGVDVRLSVVGEATASSWRPSGIAGGSCLAVAAGARLPAGADTIVPLGWTDRGRVTVTVHRVPAPGANVRVAGEQYRPGSVVARAGTRLSPPLVGLIASCGLDQVPVRPQPRVAVVATGDELVSTGRNGGAGTVVDADSYALAAAAREAGAHPHRVGVIADDAEAVRAVLEDHATRTDMIVTTGGTGGGPGDALRGCLAYQGVEFAHISVHPTPVLGFGVVGGVPVVCLPGDPGAALVGFEVLARPVLRRLAGADPVFRPSVRASLAERVDSPMGLREFRPAKVSERRGGGYTVAALPDGAALLGSLVAANALLVLGEKVGNAPIGSTVDVLMFDRQR